MLERCFREAMVCPHPARRKLVATARCAIATSVERGFVDERLLPRLAKNPQLAMQLADHLIEILQALGLHGDVHVFHVE